MARANISFLWVLVLGFFLLTILFVGYYTLFKIGSVSCDDPALADERCRDCYLSNPFGACNGHTVLRDVTVASFGNHADGDLSVIMVGAPGCTSDMEIGGERLTPSQKDPVIWSPLFLAKIYLECEDGVELAELVLRYREQGGFDVKEARGTIRVVQEE